MLEFWIRRAAIGGAGECLNWLWFTLSIVYKLGFFEMIVSLAAAAEFYFSLISVSTRLAAF